MKALWPVLGGALFAGLAFLAWVLWYFRKGIWR